MDDQDTAPLLRTATVEQRREGLLLVYSHQSAEDRAARVESLLAEIGAGCGSAEGLLVALRQDHIVGAIYSQAHPGRTAVLWPPRLVRGEPMETALRLAEESCRRLASQRVRVAHALLETEDGDRRLLAAAGFEPLARLLYLVSPVAVFPRQRPLTDLEFEPYSPANHARLVRVLEATYENTLDCPGLDNVRDLEDVLTGYRATGAFSPERWLIVRHQGKDVGCLILTDHADTESWELVYMGIVSSARGDGWGAQVTQFAQWLTRLAGRKRLVLAVDEANRPAIRIYTAAGFEAWESRIVLQRIFDGGGCAAELSSR